MNPLLVLSAGPVDSDQRRQDHDQESVREKQRQHLTDRLSRFSIVGSELFDIGGVEDRIG